MTEQNPAPEPPAEVPSPQRLVDRAARTSGLLWIEVPGDRSWPAWHAWLDGTAYVISGPGEQELPDLPGEVVLTLRSKTTLGRLIRMPARTFRVQPTDAQWEPVTAALQAGRLNAPPGDTVARWAEQNTVTALVPDGEPLEQPGSFDDASGAAPPVPSPATTDTWHPRHLGGRGRGARRRRR